MTSQSRVRLTLAAGVAAIALSGSRSHVRAIGQPTDSAPNPYQVVANHFKLPEGRTMGSTAAIDIDRDGRSVWVFERCGGTSQGLACASSHLAPVLKFDPSGKLVTSFGAGMFVSPHGIHVDRQGNIWLADGAGKDGKGQQVFKFSPDGKVLMTLGKPGVAGDSQDTFNPPSDILVAPNGDVLVRRRPRWHHERPHREVFKGRHVHQDLGRERFGTRRVRHAALARDGFDRPSVRRRPRKQSDSDLRSGRKIPRGVETVRPAKRNIHRDRNDVLYAAADTQSDEEDQSRLQERHQSGQQRKTAKSPR